MEYIYKYKLKNRHNPPFFLGGIKHPAMHRGDLYVGKSKWIYRNKIESLVKILRGFYLLENIDEKI
ncbi:hypothetical protein COL87_23980 [Bacillus pseudomycoides]|nr:hypothetical protein BLX05_18480 [Bacillus pseudomycoides]PDY13543.1 hypothetical protein COO16_05795 [Bacillus pseudomycoides]PEF74549.1 hypothetical protein CON94_14595 [Bacillus pseudomycoides]PEI43259.1 hypothetical protein CN641_19055 [Bacillus pseudomycoides]PEL88693.1 hypothetical protein CN615_08315 [Bacillus pseudomycoides]